MEPSKKQAIYVRIMEEVLPYLRNLQTHSFWRRLRYGNFYAELELVHNLGRCVSNPDFTQADAFWVATQGRLYVQQGRRDLPFYETVCGLIRELDQMVPFEMRKNLSLPQLDS